MHHDPASSPSTPTSPRTSSPDSGRTAVAVVLIVIGILALAGTLGILPLGGGLVGALLFAAVGAGLVWLARRYANDWLMFAAFPAFGLAFAAAVQGNLGGAGFLAGTGAGFLALVVAEPKRWWAVIPTGVLFTLAILAWAGDAMREPLGGSIFFLGLALTFGVVWRATARPQPWAVFPAAGCLAMALIIGLAQADWVVPVVLIVIGAALLVRDRLRHQSG